MCWQGKVTTKAVWSLRAKSVIVGNSNWVKIIIFVPHLTGLVHTSGGYLPHHFAALVNIHLHFGE